MSVCWVQAGQCGQETTIEARKVAPTKKGWPSAGPGVPGPAEGRR